jgi:chromosome segregation ATPase
MMSPSMPPTVGLDQLASLIDVMSKPETYKRKIEEMAKAKADAEAAVKAFRDVDAELKARKGDLDKHENDLALREGALAKGKSELQAERVKLDAHTEAKTKEIAAAKTKCDDYVAARHEELAKSQTQIERRWRDEQEKVRGELADREDALASVKADFITKIVALSAALPGASELN